MSSDLDRIAVSPQETVDRQVVGVMTVPDAQSRLRWAGEVAEGLARMVPEERAFIRASYADGLPHSSIAKQAGVSDESVSRAIASGMRKLAAGLERSYFAETPSTPATASPPAPNVSRWGRRQQARLDAITTIDNASF